MRIHQQKKILIAHRLSAFVEFFKAFPRKKYSQAACGFLLPLFVSHFLAVRMQPKNVLDVRALDRSSLKEIPAVKNGMVFSQSNQAPDKAEQFGIGGFRIPIDPTDLIVLAICVVVSQLRVANSIPGQQHRNPLREKQRCQKVALLTGAQGLHLWIVGWPFHAAIPTSVIVGAVAILFPVCLIVLGVVAHQILQSEAVVRGDEVDAGIGTPSAACVEIARPRNAVGKFSNQPTISFPIGPHCVAVFVVPLRPAHGKLSNLISAFAQVPRLGD